MAQPTLRTARGPGRSSLTAGGIRRGARRSQEALEVGEVRDGADLGATLVHVVGHRRELAARRLVALLREALVGDPHLDVVGLGGEDEQRLVLGLPAEPRDRAVVAVPVDRPLMPRLFFAVALAPRLARIVESMICSIRPVPKTGVGIRNTTLLLRICRSKSSCWMLQPRSLRVPGNHEEGMDATVPGPVRIVLEAGFADGPMFVMNDGISFLAPNPGCRGSGPKAGHRRARSAGGRSHVAAPATRGVEAGPRPSPTPSVSEKSTRPTSNISGSRG